MANESKQSKKLLKALKKLERLDAKATDLATGPYTNQASSAQRRAEKQREKVAALQTSVSQAATKPTAEATFAAIQSAALNGGIPNGTENEFLVPASDEESGGGGGGLSPVVIIVGALIVGGGIWLIRKKGKGK